MEVYLLHVSLRIMTQLKIAAHIARKSWHTKWNQDVSGFYTRQLIPEVGTKVFFSG